MRLDPHHGYSPSAEIDFNRCAVDAYGRHGQCPGDHQVKVIAIHKLRLLNPRGLHLDDPFVELNVAQFDG